MAVTLSLSKGLLITGDAILKVTTDKFRNCIRDLLKLIAWLCERKKPPRLFSASVTTSFGGSSAPVELAKSYTLKELRIVVVTTAGIQKISSLKISIRAITLRFTEVTQSYFVK